jgi:hypothetical protein
MHLRNHRFLTATVLLVVNLFGYRGSAADPLTTWTQVLSGIPFSITSLAYGNATFLGCGGGYRALSHDGSNWTVTATAPFKGSGSVFFAGGRFLYIANDVYTSTNGTDWTSIMCPLDNPGFTSVAYGDGKYVFVGPSYSYTAISVASTNWNWNYFWPGCNPVSVVYGNGLFAIAGNYGGTSFPVIVSSTDCQSWQFCSVPLWNYVSQSAALVYAKGVFLWCPKTSSGSFLSLLATTNLVDWTPVFLATAYNSNPIQITYSGNLIIAGHFGDTGCDVSTNGYDWERKAPFPGIGSTITFGQGTYVAATSYSSQLYGIAQSGVVDAAPSGPPSNLSIATYPGVSINGSPGAVYQIQSSTDFATWTTLTNLLLPYSPYLWVDTTAPTSNQRFYRVVQIF